MRLHNSGVVSKRLAKRDNRYASVRVVMMNCEISPMAPTLVKRSNRLEGKVEQTGTTDSTIPTAQNLAT